MRTVGRNDLRLPESAIVKSSFADAMVEEVSEYKGDLISDRKDDNGTRPFIVIAVLVCGVIGGLIMVISFIFFCKYCFKKRQPLASTMGSPGTKRQEDSMGSSKNSKYGRSSVCASSAAGGTGRKGYEVLSGSNAVVHPVPADLEAYLQQPATTNNNAPTELIVSTNAAIGGSFSKKAELQKRLTKLAEDQLLIVQTEIDGEDEYDEDPTLAQVSDSNLASLSAPNQQEDLFVTVGSRRVKRLHSKKSPSSSQDAAGLSGQHSAVDDVRGGAGSCGRQRSASSVPPRKHQDKQHRPVGAFAAAGEDSRRGSFDERVSSTDKTSRRRYPTAATGADYYASEYDRKQGAYPERPVTVTSTGSHRSEYSAHHRPRGHPKPTLSVSPAVPTTVSYEYQQPSRHPQRGALAHLPRSHQMIVDTTPPASLQKQEEYSTSSTNGAVIETSSKMYARDHRNAVSYGAAEQDFSASEKNMYARGHRLAFSFTDTGAERTLAPPPPAIHRDIAASGNGSPDRRSTDVESVSFSSALEYETLDKFCRQCRAIFQAGHGVNTTTSSSSSDQNKKNGNHVHFPHQRQVKSLDILDVGRRVGVKQQRQANSLDTACIACMNDAVNRLTLLGGDDAMTIKLRDYAAVALRHPLTSKRSAPVSSASSAAALQRQLTLIESAASGDEEADCELMQLDDAQTEQVKEECKQLWNLRSVLELDPEPDAVQEETPGIITVDDEYDGAMGQQSLDTEGETGATTSYTTSFESNTEPITVEDYLRSRPSGPYLAPPRLSVEAKRQKLRSLYARRQMQLQQQGASIESYESVETVDSSSSGRPELLLTSTESNLEPIGGHRETADGQVSLIDQHQTSLSFDSSVCGDAEPQTTVAVVPSRSNGGDYLTPSVAHRRQGYDAIVTVNGGDSAANGTETDCSKSDFLSGESFDDNVTPSATSFPPPPPPPYPNVHLVRMRRQYEIGPGGHRYPPAPPPPQLRDYCVDAKTEAIFREYLRHDPKLEMSASRGNGKKHHPRRFRYHHYDRGGISCDNESVASSGGRGDKLTHENSIDEEQQGASPSRPQTTLSSRYEIPVIRLPEDDLVSSPQHRQPAHQIAPAMAAKG